MAIVINSFTPSSPLAASGQTETFSVSATETTTPTPITLLYQWQNSTNGGSTWNNISSATSSSYTTPSLTTANNGNLYRVRVSTASPAQESFAPNSSGATLTVVPVNTIVFYDILPEKTIVNAGTNVTLLVSALYDPAAANEEKAAQDLNYQWQTSTNGVTWSNVTLSASITQTDTVTTLGSAYYKKSELKFLSISSAQNLRLYRAVLTNTISSNSPQTSSSTVFLIGNTISITKQPGTGSDTTTVSKFKTTVPSSGQATLSATAVSTAGSYSTLSYQWYFSTDITPVTPVAATNFTSPSQFSASGFTTNTLSLSNLSLIKNLQFFVAVSGTAGEPDDPNQDAPGAVVSSLATITLTQTIVMNQQPTAQTVAEDFYGDVVNRSSFPESIQSASFNASLDTVEPNGTTYPATFTWQRKNPGSSTWNNISGATTFNTNSSYDTPPVRISVDDGAYYRVQVDGYNATNEPFYSPSSNGVLLTVYRQLYFTNQPNSDTFTVGQTGAFSVTVAISSSATISYQWQLSTNNGGSWSNITNGGIYSGALTAVLQISAISSGLNGYRYRCLVSAPGVLSSITSDVGIITTQEDTFTSISQINSVQLTTGQSNTFTVTAQSVSLATISYQWQKSTNYSPSNPNAATWSNINGATSSSYTIASIASTDEAYYRCRVTSAGGVISFTNAAFLDVVVLSITVTAGYPTTLTVLEADDAAYTFNVTANPTVSASVNYQWQYSTNNGVTFVDYPASAGSNNSSSQLSSFILPALDRNLTGIRIRCKCTSPTISGDYFSTACTVSVDRRLTYTSLPSTFSVPTGQQAVLNVTSSSTGGFPTYQWQRSTNSGSTWSNLTGEIGPTLTITSPVAGYQYRAQISLTDVTSYQYFNSTSGTVVVPVSPAGSVITTGVTTIAISTATYVATYYTNEIMKSGAAVGTVVAFPKPKTYTSTGLTNDDYTSWYVLNSKGYSTKYVGYLPLTGPGTSWNANDYPELARILGNKYGGTVSSPAVTLGFLPPVTINASTGAKSGGITGTFKMPVTLGKMLLGSGNIDNNKSSPGVVPRYNSLGQSGGSVNEVGSYGGMFNYIKSEQLPPGSPGQSGVTDGSAGTSTLTPSTFTLGTFTTAGWADTQTTVPVTYTETVRWGVGGLNSIAFGSPPVHSHEMSGWAADNVESAQGAKGGGNETANCRQINYDFGVWLSGPAFLAENSVNGQSITANTNLGHTHGIALAGTDTSAQGQGHNDDRGGVGSVSISGQFNQLQSGSSLSDGTLTMSQQSNSLWNEVLSFYLRNNEALPINYKYCRLKYFIKAW
jgi:hypothetical protein